MSREYGIACEDCGTRNYDAMHYLVKDALFKRAGGRKVAGFGNLQGAWCMACLEKRIGRSLVDSDFNMKGGVMVSDRFIKRYAKPNPMKRFIAIAQSSGYYGCAITTFEFEGGLNGLLNSAAAEGAGEDCRIAHGMLYIETDFGEDAQIFVRELNSDENLDTGVSPMILFDTGGGSGDLEALYWFVENVLN